MDNSKNSLRRPYSHDINIVVLAVGFLPYVAAVVAAGAIAWGFGWLLARVG